MIARVCLLKFSLIEEPMSGFTDLNFIFRFLPIVLFINFLAGEKARRLLILAESLAFYALLDLRALPLLIFFVVLNFILAKKPFQKGSRGKYSYFFIITALDLATLFLFKLMNLFSGGGNFSVDGSASSFLLPAGISFYLFKMISFQIDLYRGLIPRNVSFLDCASYFCLFPQITSGPIMRFQDYMRNKNWSRLSRPSTNNTSKSPLPMIEDGLFYFVAGLSLKVLLADHLSMIPHQAQAIGFSSISTTLAWICAYAYSLQIYFDFWGYSLMASGIAVMLGFPFIQNFDHPYAATSVTSFYRKWHITLGLWFRDYLYIPLGGSKRGDKVTIRNLFIVWFFTALWHGFALHFILWGLSLCLLIVWEKMVLDYIPFFSKIFGRFHVLVLVPLTWVFFSVEKSADLPILFSRLFPFLAGKGANATVFAGDYQEILSSYAPYLLCSALLLIPFIYRFLEQRKRSFVTKLLLLALFWLSVTSLLNNAANPFLYLRF